MTMKAITYGEYDMQAGGVRVIETDVLSSPKNKIQADSLAERDGALIVKQQYDSKTFRVKGIIRATTEADFEAALDAFKLAMGRRSQPFDIAYGGSVRRYLASAQNVMISTRGTSAAGFDVEFLSADGMGWDAESSVLIPITNLTASNQTIDFTVDGTYKADPQIRVEVVTVTGGTTDKTLTLTNAGTLRSISVTRDWANEDVLEIDTLKGQVLVNGVPTEFRGQLPSFLAGDAAIVYVDDFTTRNVNINASYTRRFL